MDLDDVLHGSVRQLSNVLRDEQIEDHRDNHVFDLVEPFRVRQAPPVGHQLVEGFDLAPRDAQSGVWHRLSCAGLRAVEKLDLDANLALDLANVMDEHPLRGSLVPKPVDPDLADDWHPWSTLVPLS